MIVWSSLVFALWLEAPSPRHQAVEVNNAGVELARKNDLEGAVKALREATTVDPSYAYAWLNLGHLMRQRGKLDEAKRAFSSGLDAKEPALEGELRYQLGRTIVRQSEAEGLTRAERVALTNEALEHLQAAANVEPWRARAHYSIGRCREFLDEPTKADLAYRRAIEADPTDSVSYTALGMMYIEYGFPNEGLAILQVNVTVNNRTADAWHGLGRGQLASNKPAEAVDAFNKARAIDPDRVDVLFNLGMAYAELRDRKHAVEVLEQFLTRADADVPEHLRKAANNTIARMQDAI